MLNSANLSTIDDELPLKLARKSVNVFGTSVIEEGKTKNQVDFGYDEETVSLQSGKEFALMLTNQGRIYYTGKSSALGHKQPCPNGQWNELAITKASKFVQCAIGKRHALKKYDQFVLNTSCFWRSIGSNITPFVQFHEVFN